MKRFVALMVVVFGLATVAFSSPGSTKLNGWISDSMCGAKHMGDNPSCVKKCIHEMGSAPVFVDEAQKAVWTIENPDAVKDFYGDHVTITATVDSSTKSVHIDAIAGAK